MAAPSLTNKPPSPALPSAPGPSHNLPAPLTRFVGHERDLTELPRLLQENRLLTLTGPGGVGKTRLALELAHAALRTHAGDYRGGVWLVDLAPVFDPRLVASVAASALGVPEVLGQPIGHTLADALAQKQLLLVLDNCEHVLAAAAALADELLRRCPEVQVLATSREALNVAGEVAWLVPSLALDAEAVGLFVDRAAAALPNADPATWNLTAVREICRRLDGIPLAIELAATRVKALSVEQIAARLDDRFRLLDGGLRTALPRHQTLRALVDWSHELLPDQERRLFRRVSVFAGGWTLAAAEAVCSGDGIEEGAVLGLLSRLIEKSLVVAEEHAGHYRYRLLETLRQYAAEHLDAAGEADALRTRHLTYCVAFAERAWDELWGPHMSAYLACLEPEVDNIRAALQWSLTSGHILLGLRLAGAPHGFWLASGRAAEGRDWSERLLARAPAEAPDAAWQAAMARALGTVGQVACAQGDLAAARRPLEVALDLSRQLDDRRDTAFWLRWLGRVLIMEGAPDAARPYLEESLSLARALGDRATTFHALHGLAIVANQQGDLDTSIERDEEALVLGRETRDALQIHLATLTLANAAVEQGNLAAARRWLAECLASAPKNGGHIAPSLEVFAHLAAVQAQPERALRLAGAAAAARRDTGGAIPPRARAVIQRRLEAARHSLDAQTAASVWAEGQAMDLHAAMAYALAAPDDMGAAPGVPGAAGCLTGREREVAVLLGRGLTNHQIAARLVITPGTAKRHVENILAKLGLSSRAQVAAWAAQHGWLEESAPAS